MNERIGELRIQAFETVNALGVFDTEREVEFCKEFAALIIKDCADFVDSHEHQDKYGYTYEPVYGADIKKHFGVE